MSVKCPSCGFESADEARWCDMCKEPFNKRRVAVAPPPAAAAPPALPDAAKKAEELLEDIPLEDPEKVPAVPKWARLAAWVFLGLWVIFGFIMMGVTMARYEDARARAPISHDPQ